MLYLLVIGIAILAVTGVATEGARRRQQAPKFRCRWCGYDLRAGNGYVCWNCGAPVHPSVSSETPAGAAANLYLMQQMAEPDPAAATADGDGQPPAADPGMPPPLPVLPLSGPPPLPSDRPPQAPPDSSPPDSSPPDSLPADSSPAESSLAAPPTP